MSFCFFVLFFAVNLSAKAAETTEIGTNTGIGYDDEFQTIPIGFDFKFYDNTYSQAYVHTNGFLTFTAPHSATNDLSSNAVGYYSTSQPIPTNPTTNLSNKMNRNFIAAFWDDLVMAPPTDTRPVLGQNAPFQPSIYYKTVGTAPNRVLIVQWTNMYFFNSTTPMGTFQVYLYEGSNDIQIQYRSVFGGNLSTGSNATIGIQNNMNPASGIKYSYRTANAISEKKAIRFTKVDDTISNYTMNSAAAYENFYVADNTIPAPPVLSSPTAGSVAGPGMPVLTWSPSNEAAQPDSYKLYISNNALFLNGGGNAMTTISIPDPATTSWQTTGLTDSTTYYWRVESINSNGSSISGTSSFTYDATLPVITMTGLSLTPSSLSIAEGASAATVATATYSDDSSFDVTNELAWTFSHSNIASIHNGVVSGIHAGTTVATATYGDFSAQLSITVTPVMTGLTLTPSSLSILERASATTVATATYSNASTYDVTNELVWTFSRSNIASIDNGIVSGIHAGTTVATATYGGQSAQLNITVTPVAVSLPYMTGLRVTPSSLTVPEGASATTVATATYSDASTFIVTNDLVWTFSNPGIASVRNGIVAGIHAGTTVATATYGEYTAQLNITVTPVMTGLTLTPDSLFIVAGGSATTEATAAYSDARNLVVTNDLIWTFSQPDIVSIHKGVVTGIQPGTTIATATYGEHTAQLSLTVRSRSTTSGGGTSSTTSPSTNPTPAPTTEEPRHNPFVSSVVTNIDGLISNIKQLLEANKAAKVTFTDTTSHWAASDIGIAARLHIIEGYQDGSFKPNASVTRAEFSAMIVRAFNLTAAFNSASFRDVEQDHWAKSYIEILASNNIVNGYEDLTFQPGSEITRAEMLTMISRILKLKDLSKKGAEPSFADVNSDYWAKDTIKEAANAGIIQGVSKDHFAPENTATRAEALTLIIRALKTDTAINDLLK
ncbi:S-layer homology domain-containing protein [Paenibacillus sp. UNC451MF]|uniref:S-layer homology domain-containing protein n=1 Tax=Paenibacillus sp. UNC451MF TaxID=1449063 RepID=UPI0018CC0E44|nr:S-layer homology domain-containing protein [Paenibacillus sp. UNC451MF]